MMAAYESVSDLPCCLGKNLEYRLLTKSHKCLQSKTLNLVWGLPQHPGFRTNLGVLSHHPKCEMKSPRLVDFS